MTKALPPIDPGKPAVGVLGLGAMGTALARALLAAGHPTTVWNRSATKAAALVAEGATAAATPAEAIAAGRLVVACLLDDASVRDVLATATDVLGGRVLVNLTSGTPAQARAMAEWARSHDVEHLDGGIMAVPPMIGTPAAFVLYSGSRSAFDTHLPVLEAFGAATYVGDDPGMAALQDIALLSGMYGMVAGVLQAYALVRSAQVPATEFAPLLQRWLAAMGGFPARAAEQIDAKDYTTGVVSNLAMQASAYPLLLEAAADEGVDASLVAPLLPLMQRRVAAGHGAEDLSGLIELLGGGDA